MFPFCIVKNARKLSCLAFWGIAIATAIQSRPAAANGLSISPVKQGPQGWSFAFPTESNRLYNVHYGTFSQPFWWTLTNLVGDGLPAKILDPENHADQRVYKVFVQNPLSFVTIGHVSATTARIAIGLDKARDLRLLYSPNPDLSQATEIAPPPLDASEDFTRAIDLKSLQPITRYYYNILLDGRPEYSGPYPSFSTGVPNGWAVNLRFAFGSCFRGTVAGGNATYSFSTSADANSIWELILAKSPAFVIHLGDTAYCDNFGALSLASYRQIHRHMLDGRLLNMAGYAHLRASVPLYTTLDDHEIRNDWPWDPVAAEPWDPSFLVSGRKAFHEYSGRGNPDPYVPGELYYSFQFGNVGFFMTDGRSFRSAQQCEDSLEDLDGGAVTLTFSGTTATASGTNWNAGRGFSDGLIGRTLKLSDGRTRYIVSRSSPSQITVSQPAISGAWNFAVLGKTLLGAEQKQHLKNWLLQNKTSLRVKFIAASTPINGLTEHVTRKDSWGAGYVAELNEILDFIVANGIKNVIFLSGDQHWSGSFNRKRGNANFFEFMSSPFSAFWFPMYSDSDTNLLSRALWMWDVTIGNGTGDNFGLVTVRTDQNPVLVKFELFDTLGNFINSTILVEGPNGLELQHQ